MCRSKARRCDRITNKKRYKKEIHARDIVLHQAVRPPASAKQLLSILNSKSPEKQVATRLTGAWPT